MPEIVPILPQHITPHLKMTGVTMSQAANTSQRGVARPKAVTRTRRAGWGPVSVDRNNEKARKVEGKVVTPAEAVRLEYTTNGYSHHYQQRDEETPRLIHHLTSQGFTVTPLSMGNLLVTREHNGT